MIQEYKLKDGSKRYLIKVYLGLDSLTGKRITTTRRGYKTKKEAVLSEARLKLAYENNAFKNNSMKYTFKQVYELFLIEHRNVVKPGTYSTTVRYAKLHILPKVGNKKIDSFSVIDCQRLVNQWAEYFNSAKYPKGITQQVFDFAIKLNLISDNPMKKVRLPKKKAQVLEINKFYSTEELKKFFSCLEDYGNLKFNAFFRILAFTGMRKGEALALTWKDINFSSKTIDINKTFSIGLKRKQIIQAPKTKASIRVITIDDKTLEVLNKWKITQAIQLLEHGYNSMNENQLIFTTFKGNKYIPLEIPSYWFNKFCNKNGFEIISIHGFRHTHCSLLFESGVPMKDVQERLGHSDIQTTMNIYTHVTENSRENSAKLFANYVGF